MKRIIILTLVISFITLNCFCGESEKIEQTEEYKRNFAIGLTLETLYLGLKCRFWLKENNFAMEIGGLPTSIGSWGYVKVLKQFTHTKYNRTYLGMGVPLGLPSSNPSCFIGFENYHRYIPMVVYSYEFGIYKLGDVTVTSFSAGINLYF